MKLIDADKLIDYFCQCCGEEDCDRENTYCVEREFTKKCLNEMPTIDAVAVVRCKDCKWGREVCGNIECSADLNIPPEYHGYEWFCPNGERREDETN